MRRSHLGRRPGGPLPAQSKVASLPAAVLDQYTGKLLFGDRPGAPAVSIARADDHLVITFPLRPAPLEMLRVSETEFDMPSTFVRFTFHKDDQGNVTGVLFQIGDGQREMKKITR